MSRTFTLALTFVLGGNVVGFPDLTPRPPLRTGEGVFNPCELVVCRDTKGSAEPWHARKLAAMTVEPDPLEHPRTGGPGDGGPPASTAERGTGGEVFRIARQDVPPRGAKPDKPAPVAAKTVTLKAAGTLSDVSAEVAKQTGLALDLSAVDDKAKVNVNFNNAPAWQAIEAVADQANCFVSVAGDRVKLSRRPNGVGAVPSGIDGPFRVVLKRVIAKRDTERADAEYELHLEVQWEPRFPVFLIDTEPKATAVLGKQKIAADAPTGRAMPGGYTHAAVVRVKGVPREAKQIDELAGSFRVVAAAKMLAVEFKDLTGDKPVSQSVEGVTVTLHPVKKFEKRAEFGVELEYPESHPEFESFQLWSGGNTFRLFKPNDRTGVKPADYSSEERGRRVRADYNFTGPNGGMLTLPDLKGWRVVYETPGPMSEQTVQFSLKGIALP